MPSLVDTLGRLGALNRRQQAQASEPRGRLLPLDHPGSNPGALDAYYYLPESFSAGAPLVVVLHGCTQTASGYDNGAGWSYLADKAGFALLVPQQRRANNANLCFNWFEPADTRRGSGEALSIKQMVDTMVDRHGVDSARIFVTGLSAGGAMTSVMLATYPETFAGGAIIAGLPFGRARSVPEAFERMRGQGKATAADLAAAVRAASPHNGPWPRVSVWHGTSDATVDIANADECLAQWLGVHELDASAAQSDIVDGQPHRSWRDRNGRVVVEDYRIGGLGHGTPLSTLGDDPCGCSAPFMLEAGISSTQHIAAFWGIAGNAGASASADAVPPSEPRQIDPQTRRAQLPPALSGPAKVIEDALRAAGLMR